MINEGQKASRIKRGSTSSALTRSTVRGVAWSGLSQVLGQGVRLLATIVLARLLMPEDFGLIAMATIIITFLQGTADLGFSSAIIQRKDVSTDHLSTAFWTGLVLGIILCVVAAAISPLLALFFNNELVTPLIAASSLAFVILPLGAVHGALLMKNLQFFKFRLGDIGMAIAYLIVAVTLAFTGFGVWSIILGNLAGCLILVILRWALCSWHPSAKFSFKCLKELWSFGMNITGIRVVQTITERLDYLIMGRFLAATILGFYSMSYRIVDFSANRLWQSVTPVAFSAFSTIQDEDERLRRGFKRSISYVSLISLPLFVGLVVVAPEFVTVIFGQKWALSILPMQILCGMAAFNSISSTVGSILRSKGRPDIEFKISLVRMVLLASGLLIAVRFGTVGVAIAVSAVAAIIWLPRQIFANRLVSLKMREYFSALRPATLGSIVMALAMLAFRYASTHLFILPDIGLLISSILIGAAVYFATLKITKTETLDEMIRLVSVTVRAHIRPTMVKLGLMRNDAFYIIDD